jgi:hypothetical protein
MNSPPPSFTFISPSLIHWTVLTFHIWVHSIYTIITFLHPFHISSLSKCKDPDSTSFTLLFSFFWKTDIFHFIMYLYRKFHYDISTYICTLTWICSSPLFPPLLPWSHSYVDFYRFKYSIFILIQRVYQLYSPS